MKSGDPTVVRPLDRSKLAAMLGIMAVILASVIGLFNNVLLLPKPWSINIAFLLAGVMVYIAFLEVSQAVGHFLLSFLIGFGIGTQIYSARTVAINLAITLAICFALRQFLAGRVKRG